MAFASPTTLSDAIAARFRRLRDERRRALVCYLTAGHPDYTRSLDLLRGIVDAGADIVEVGVPFSDPLADGPVIQASSQLALQRGMTFDRTLDLISEARVDCPVVLFSYLNPIIAAGPDALTRASSAGARGLLITDLPLGADVALEKRFAEGPLDYIRLVAPTTPRERMADIAHHGSGFVYLISRLGVTGERSDIAAELPATISRLRSVTDLPVCVGFGISKPEQAATVGRMADGVVVGSAIVRAAESSVDSAIELVHALRTALDAI
jgi:tryptophan synthase alpha chain